MTAKVVIEVSKQDLKNILITAVESGVINYWAEVKSYNHERGTVTVREHLFVSSVRAEIARAIVIRRRTW